MYHDDLNIMIIYRDYGVEVELNNGWLIHNESDRSLNLFLKCKIMNIATVY